jgi:ubiquinone/menaquinone biosynthesis C-methylase UbiE
MQRTQKIKNYKVKEKYLDHFLREYWFTPSDVLQRGIEANVWEQCQFKSPVLDVGVGDGTTNSYIFKGKIDVGIDLNSKGLRNARKIGKYKKLVHASAEDMPFKNASFNTIVSNSTFEHISNDLKAVSEVVRVLKEGGLFFLTVPSEYLQKWVLEYDGRKKLKIFNRRANHLHYRSLQDWKKYLKKNSLEIIFYKYYFKKNVALFWYKLFKQFTHKFSNRELWSVISDSKIVKFIPKRIVTSLLKNLILKDSYKNGFFTDANGAQLFMIAKKICLN